MQALRSTFLLTVILLAALPAAGQQEDLPRDLPPDLELARDLYQSSREAGISDGERRDRLRRSLDLYPTYLAHYELGKLERLTGDLPAALVSFEAAFDLTDQDEYLARAAYQIGVTHQRLGRYVEARSWLRRSLSFGGHAEVRDALRALELSRKGQLTTAPEILEEIEVGRAFGVAKAELRIHFELDLATLDHLGRRQADELGKALSDRRWRNRGEIFLFLGHTDLQCPGRSPSGVGCDRYNLELSERRAATVRRFVVDRFALAAGQVRTVGCGRQHLLSHRVSENDHYLNRRVVVMAVDPAADDFERLCSYDAGLL